MTQAQSHFLQVAFDRFREITRGLPDLDAEGQVAFLKYELLQALERADELRQRGRDLERRLEELRARDAARAQLSLEIGTPEDVAAWMHAYDERLQIAADAYRAMRRRCSTLEERCEALLATIERAAFRDDDDAAPAPDGHESAGAWLAPDAPPAGDAGTGADLP